MFKINKLYAIVALTAAPAAFVAPMAIADELSRSGEFLDGIVAIVNEGVVLKSKLRDETAQIIQRAQENEIPLPPADILQEQVLERLILNEIQLQRADRIGLEVSDPMLNETIARMANDANVRFEDMPALLEQDGMSYQEFRAGLREEITLEQLRRIDVGRSIEVSDREIEQCIADLEDNVVVNSTWNLSHILIAVPDGASSKQIDEIKLLAQEVYDRIMQGTDFREMAVTYSKGPTALEGGGLGWIEGDQVPTIFLDVLSSMQAGDVSQPFRTANSFHIVKVNELRSAIQRSEVKQTRARHILITPNEIIDDETARQQLDNALERIAAGEDFSEIAKLISDDPGSAALGGDLDWAGPGTFVPEFETTMADLEIGEVSQPFRSPFGWHIIEVTDRRVYDNTEDQKRRNCDLRIRNSKMEEETNLWLQRIRDEAFVEKRI